MELELRGIRCERQVAVPLKYKGRRLRRNHRVDVMVEEALVVEIKAVQKVVWVHECQLVS